jgi:hypothetical protein
MVIILFFEFELSKINSLFITFHIDVYSLICYNNLMELKAEQSAALVEIIFLYEMNSGCFYLETEEQSEFRLAGILKSTISDAYRRFCDDKQPAEQLVKPGQLLDDADSGEPSPDEILAYAADYISGLDLNFDDGPGPDWIDNWREGCQVDLYKNLVQLRPLFDRVNISWV